MKNSFALISVYDKTGILNLAQGLLDNGISLLASHGSHKYLAENGIKSLKIEDYTKTKQMIGDRVKTLHPNIFASILYDRDNKNHKNEMSHHSLIDIDYLIINLYPFMDKVSNKTNFDQAIELIDIGGVSLIRAGSKNFKYIGVITDVKDYDIFLNKINQNKFDQNYRMKLARKAFQYVIKNDNAIENYLHHKIDDKTDRELLVFSKKNELLYGENPHQKSFLYSDLNFDKLELIQGKKLSYNNFLDITSAYNLSFDLNKIGNAVCIIKHNSPCGVCLSKDDNYLELYEKALSSDKISPFGGILCCNFIVDESLTKKILEFFYECVIAKDFTQKSLDLFKNHKPGLRIIKVNFDERLEYEKKEIRSTIGSNLLYQDIDNEILNSKKSHIVTKISPDENQWNDLIIADIIAKHSRSNAIAIVKDRKLIGIGSGHLSRIGAVKWAIIQASENDHNIRGAVAASDGFFPFKDSVENLALNGISAIVQPGGSKKDADSILIADKYNISMVFSKVRHFKH